ncbi:MAG TPA: acyl-CoA dehydrogenase family protein, partial [Streptosporangiaceae bacterium]|nr:acyl-CoA dehydrogenase family protein [Streptosporangiaceae bacterium]
RSEKRLGTVPVIEHQNVGFMLADIKMRIEACRYLAWKACHDFERSGGRAEELAIMTKVYCSEAAVATVYDCMRVIGIASYTKDLAPLERIMRDAMVFPLYDGGNQGVRRRQLHDILRHPGYDSMLAARGEPLPENP